MIRKILIYYKSDGIKETITFIIKSLMSFIYKNSTTNFYKSGNTTYNLEIPQHKNITIKEITTSELINIKFPRLELLPCKKWMQNGSKLYICFFQDKPIAFTWSHFNNYQIHGVGKFTLKQDEYWIGPTFVHKNYRGLGLNKYQIHFQMSKNKEKIAVTSVNHNNIASIKSFEHWNFSLIGQVFYKRSLFKQNISFSNNELKQLIR